MFILKMILVKEQNTYLLNIDSLEILNARPSATYFEIRLNKGVADYSLNAVKRQWLSCIFLENLQKTTSF